MKLGTLDISKIYLGSTEVAKAYLGVDEVFGGGGGVPTDRLQFYIDATNSSSYPGSGTNVTDLSPNGYDFELLNGTPFTSSPYKTWEFDGFMQYMEAYGPGPEMGSNSVTINAWINRGFGGGGSPDGSTVAGRMEPGFSGSSDGSYGLMVSNTGSIQGFFKANNEPSYIQTYANSSITSGQWVLATAVFDRAGSIKLYVNGVEQSLATSGDISSYSAANVTNSSNYYKVGAASYFGSADAYFEGKVSQVIEYSKVLTQPEILSIFNATKANYGL